MNTSQMLLPTELLKPLSRGAVGRLFNQPVTGLDYAEPKQSNNETGNYVYMYMYMYIVYIAVSSLSLCFGSKIWFSQASYHTDHCHRKYKIMKYG